jgi:multiple sugar transport system substrate-binding protein
VIRSARRPPGALAAVAALGLGLAACGGGGAPASLEFWALGREGELVRELLPDFERRHPGLRVRVQQIPWSAAHEKLLTAYAGDALPDVFQLGNTWVPEFVALRALAPLDARVAVPAGVERADYFEGVWDTNVVDGETWGVPWYVDTRLLFYRADLLARAGHADPPRTWDEWLDAMSALKAQAGPAHYAILLPSVEWQLQVILGLQRGAELLRDDARFGAFSSPAFRAAFTWYVDLFRRELAPRAGAGEVGNLYRDFASGRVAMLVSGPWNLGELRRRLPGELQDAWATAPLPAPDPAAPYPGVSLAGGSSLVLSRASRRPDDAWALVEYLSDPPVQAAFARLSGDLPPRRSAWPAAGLADDPRSAAFGEQLQRAVPLPKIPEWERIASRLARYSEAAVRGDLSVEEALAALDRDVDAILAKRRWLLRRRGGAGAGKGPA